jgi:flagellar hook-associated protein 1 FlgK
MSLSSLFSIARSALLAHQRAMSVTAHNVANAQTPGYSRQRLDLVPADPLRGPLGTIGRGVTEAGISRARDRFFDAAFRRESGLLSGSGTLANLLSQVEAAVHEPSDVGIAATLDGMFKSFADLANDPSSGPNRELVRQAATRLIQQLHQLDAQIGAVAQDAVDRMKSEVAEVNSLASRIAALNSEILSAGGPGRSAPDLEDQRDLLVDRLSSMISVRVLQREDGTISVLAGDTMLVDAAAAQSLAVQPLATGGFRLVSAVGGGTVDPGSGSLKALVDLTTTTLPGIQLQLDKLAAAIVTEVNAIHRTGYTPAGSTGTDFFDPSGVTARTIALAPPIAASGSAIAAGGTAAPGDGSIAQRIADLAGARVGSLGGKSLREFYVEIAASVGLDVLHATQDAETQQALVDQAELQRSSVSGVSIEEEMIALIAQQQAYSAATRIITAADEMIQDLLNMI